MENIASFLINLDQDDERLEVSKKLLSAANIPFERLSAVNGKAVTETPSQNALSVTGRNLTPGEIGCFLSHQRAAEAFLESGKPLGLVLEDDIQTEPNSLEVLNAFSRDHNNFPPWSFANLARPCKYQFTKVSKARWTGPIPLYSAHYMPVTTTAILWNRKGAKEFLQQKTEFVYPVDVFLQRWVARQGCGLAFLSPPFASREDESTIGVSRSTGGNLLSHAQRHRLTRLISTHIAAKRHKRNANKS